MVRRTFCISLATVAAILLSAGNCPAGLVINVTAFDFTNSGFDAAKQTLAQNLFVAAENAWLAKVDAPFGSNVTVTIAKVDFKAIGGNGATIGASADTNGLPSTVNEIDISNAASMFYSNTITGIGANQRDAYSTMLHELGHAIGFNYLSGGDGYQKWNDRITGTNFLLADGTTNVTLSGAGANGLSHVSDTTYPNDLMKTTGANGVRDSISTLDVQMLQAAFNYQAVPEPATIHLALAGFGLMGLYRVSRRRNVIAA